MRISLDVARRFLLGRQGLWPGRRWRGLVGTERAMRAMEHVQLDPLRVVARAQDLALQGRVLDYGEDDWARLTYEQRRFFEWGGWLAVRPIDELPYYRALMRRSRAWGRMPPIEREHRAAIEEMRLVLRERGEVSNRDFTMGRRTRVDSYRGRKDSALALYYLWRLGEAMVTRRTSSFERVYAPAEAVVPARYLEAAGDAEADDYLLRKAVADAGFSRLTGANSTLHRDITPAELGAWRDRGLAAGELIELEIEGLRQSRLALGADRTTLAALAAGRLPRGWKPLERTTREEVSFLSPLDPVILDRNRTRALFDFDYKWEVYVPDAKRQYGYYVLPILWGDRLVGRTDVRFERAVSTLRVLGMWFEDGVPNPVSDGELLAALRAGFRGFAAFLGAGSIDIRVGDPLARQLALT